MSDQPLAESAQEWTDAARDLQRRMIHLSGIEPRLGYLLENCSPEGIAAGREYVRLSRLADYEDTDLDGLRWASYTHAAIAKRLVSAILADVFQGKKDHLRDHMLGVAARVDRQAVMEPWWESRVVELAAQAWDEGHRYCSLAESEHGECVNPYRPSDNPTPPD